MAPKRNFATIALLLFVLVSIPVTVIIARRANLGSSASSSAFAFGVTPPSQSLARGESYAYTLEFNFSDGYKSAPRDILLHFSDLPTGVTMTPQPIGATKSNNYQSLHKFNLVVSPSASAGEHSIRVEATDLSTSHETNFTLNIQ